MSDRAPLRRRSTRLVSVAEAIQLILPDDSDYDDSGSDDSACDSSGSEYRPTRQEIVEMEDPIVPVSRSGSRASGYTSPPPPSVASTGRPRSPADEISEDEDVAGGAHDPMSFLYIPGQQKQGRKRSADDSASDSDPGIPSSPPRVTSPTRTASPPPLPSPPPPMVSPLKPNTPCTFYGVSKGRGKRTKVQKEDSDMESDPDDPKTPPPSRHQRRLYSTPPASPPPHASPPPPSSPPPPASPPPPPSSPQPGPSHRPDTARRPSGQRSGRVIARARGTRSRTKRVTLIRTPSRSIGAPSRSIGAPSRSIGAPSRSEVRERVWEWREGSDYVPNSYHFRGEREAGPQIPNMNRKTSRLDIFLQFFTANLMAIIVDQTNWYNYYYMGGKTQTRNSARLSWTNVTSGEMYIFLAIVILMGVVKKTSIRKYWSCDPLITTPIFGKIMSRNRFTAIMGNLHFTDSLQSHKLVQEIGHANKDPMERIRPIFEYLKVKFAAAFRPHQKVIIDESLVLWRGNIGICQYIPSKRHRYGLKLFVMCDCKTGYIQDMILYMGTKTELVPERQYGISGAVVITMMKDYLNKGHILYLDNWYSSPSLAQYLHDNGTGMCGTVKRNRAFMPPLPTRREADSIIYLKANNVLLLSWMDNRDVNVLTTCHSPVFEPARSRVRGTGERVQKPVAINDYNINMRLVDKSDAVISSVECARRTMRWYKKLFFHLLDMTLYNSHILHGVITGESETMENYCIELSREMLAKHIIEPRHQQKPAHHRPAPEGPARLTERHFVKSLPANPGKQKPCRRCHVCRNTTRKTPRRKDTRFYCPKCDVGLCLEPCFEDYHTLEHF